MATDFKAAEQTGDWEMWLDCPECDFSGLIYYTTKPPLFCSQRCRQRARRQRQKQYVTEQQQETVTYLQADGQGLHYEHAEYGRVDVLHLVCECGRGIFTPPGNANFAAIVCGACGSEFRGER